MISRDHARRLEALEARFAPATVGVMSAMLERYQPGIRNCPSDMPSDFTGDEDEIIFACEYRSERPVAAGQEDEIGRFIPRLESEPGKRLCI